MHMRYVGFFDCCFAWRVSLLSLGVILAGCACDGTGWESDIVPAADATEWSAESECDLSGLSKLSEDAAEYVRRADSETLEIARLEALNDCRKAAEREHSPGIK